MAPTARIETPPRLVVALATYNGAPWIREQLESILGQEGVELRVVVSDDGSSDGTLDLIDAAGDPRVTILPAAAPTGGAARNFFRLIRDVDLAEGEWLALADQDDVWLPGKLARAIERLDATGADGYASDLVAFWPDGRERRVVKSQPQRAHDFLTQTPSAGSTFVLSRRLVTLVKGVLAGPRVDGVFAHDWLVYALCRAHGWTWTIDAAALIRYRQHGGNEVGANLGARAAADRFARIRSRWHRTQCLLVTELAATVANDAERPALGRFAELFGRTGLAARWALAARAGELRRLARDRFILRSLILSGLW